MTSKRFSGILALLIMLSLVLTACGGDTATATPPPPPPTDTAAPAAATNTTAPAAPAATDTAAAPAAAATDTVAAPAAAATDTPAASASGMTKDKAPAVPNPNKAYSGQTITYYGDTVGLGAELDQALVKQFTADTGIVVKIIPKPQSATENYSTYQRLFQAQSPDIDVMMLDVIWPGAFAPHLLDLSGKLGDLAKLNYEGIIANNTVGGKLVAMPWFGDFGMLYYRTDLLKKYGFSAPPATWDELQTQAQQIMDGEKTSNPNFTGFVFQGNSYEGLTTNALEWIYSNGGGQIVENGKVTIDNPQAVEILNKAKGWVGTISPPGVTTYQEEDARNAFQGGNAAFMRNWPYAYAAAKTPDKDGKLSPIADKFDVAPLPHGPTGKSAGTVGGWQLGVSKYSKNPDASIEFVRYMTSPEVETWRAVVGSFVPTQAAVAADPNVLTAMPFLKNLTDVVRVTRPSKETGLDYNEVSTDIFQGINAILKGGDAASGVKNIADLITPLIPKQ